MKCVLGFLLILAAGRPADAQIIPEPLATFTGVVKDIDGKALTLDEADGNTLRFVCTRKTRYYDGNRKIKASAIKSGAHVTVETKRFPDGELEAINVRLEHPKAP